MQQETITIAGVDVAGVPTDRLYSRAKATENRNVYTGPASTLSTRNDLTLSRRYNTVVGNSQGVAESRAKFAYDKAVPGRDVTTSVEHVGSVESIIRIPVGMSDDDIDTMLSEAAIFMVSAEGKALAKGLSI